MSACGKEKEEGKSCGGGLGPIQGHLFRTKLSEIQHTVTKSRLMRARGQTALIVGVCIRKRRGTENRMKNFVKFLYFQINYLTCKKNISKKSIVFIE